MCDLILRCGLRLVLCYGIVGVGDVSVLSPVFLHLWCAWTNLLHRRRFRLAFLGWFCLRSGVWFGSGTVSVVQVFICPCIRFVLCVPWRCTDDDGFVPLSGVFVYYCLVSCE